jgi:hypothetical protein
MIDDEWTNAIMALIASTEPDTKLLAMWLRSEKPIPPGIRDALAEPLNPGEPPLYNVRLTPEFIWTRSPRVKFGGKNFQKNATDFAENLIFKKPSEFKRGWFYR